MIVQGISRLSIQFANGDVWEHTPDRFEIRRTASGASGEGVEGEPVATLGGVKGSPQGSYWCRFCGADALDQMQCVKCWTQSFETSVQVTGKATQEFADALTPVIGAALGSGRSLDRASQSMARTLGQFGSNLKRLAG